MVLLIHRSASLLVLLLSYLQILVLAGPVNTTLRSTHPQVTYAPESCCMRNPFKRCIKRYDPFTMSTYIDPASGMKRRFFQTSSWGNEPYNSNMKRRVEVVFHGHAVYVYGPPREHLDNRPGHIEIWIDNRLMDTIDLEAKYWEASTPWNPLLMYHWEGVYDEAHTLEINLLDSASGASRSHPIRGFGLDSIVYTSNDALLPPKYRLSISEKLENITIHDTNFVSKFSPAFAWDKQVSSIPSTDGIRTSHATSNELAYGSWRDGSTPVAEFTAQCAGMAVYGASPAQLDVIFQSGFRQGHAQICYGGRCEYIDADQAYLNVPDHLRNEPVLLYVTDRMEPTLSQTVTMRMLDPPSPVGHLWAMTFARAVCSQIAPKWSGTHPISGGRYTKYTIQYNQLSYGPSYFFGLISPWSWLSQYSVARAEPMSWFLGLFGGKMPTWSAVVTGHDVKIFLPFPAARYSNVLCCIDGRCHYPDVEQWYMKVRDASTNVPFVHYQDLHPFKSHHISMTAVRGQNDFGEKIIAVSYIEVQRVVMSPPPPPPPPSSSPSPTSTSISSEPTERLPSPNAPAHPPPMQYSDNIVRVFGIVAMAVVMIVLIWRGCSCWHIIIWGSFRCFWCMSVPRRDPGERQPLIGGSRPQPVSPPLRLPQKQ